MSALFATTIVPHRMAEDRHGIHQRIALMLSGLRATYGSVDVLLLPAYDSRPDATYFSRLEAVRAWMASDLGEGFRVHLTAFGRVAPRWIDRVPRGAWYFGAPPLYDPDDESVARIDAFLAGRNHEVAFAHPLQAYSILRRCASLTRTPMVLDLNDVEHVAFARQTLLPPMWRAKRLRLIHCASLLAEELRAFRHCEQVYVCSAHDVRRLAPFDRRSRVREIPNAVPDPCPGGVPSEPADEPRVLWVGTLSYAPNRAGLAWFLGSVWPSVVERLPGARFTIVGQDSREFPIPAPVAHSVDALGFVDNLPDVYASSSVVVCPLQAGGGTRIKIIEAASHGRPVVSTTIGAEGLNFVDGDSIEIADAADGFAAKVLDLLMSPHRRLDIGRAARALFLARYERGAAIATLRRSLDAIGGSGRILQGVRS